jgi:hypothetical protein
MHYIKKKVLRDRIGHCLICGKEYRAFGDFEGRVKKYCSRVCFQKDWANRIRKMIPSPIGSVGEKNGSWKGDKVGYSGLHRWIAKHLGKPLKCQHCGSITKRKYEWANIDHQYRRVKKDFMRLCTSCHRRYDLSVGLV